VKGARQLQVGERLGPANSHVPCAEQGPVRALELQASAQAAGARWGTENEGLYWHPWRQLPASACVIAEDSAEHAASVLHEDV